ncbi:MAG TPA: PepSY domain-containing protein, partial [Edaphobacter sp.]|nr:PepSY domain-containing protein [Edaphobacter sp.]
MTAIEPNTISRRFLPDQRTVWRWHFYAGLFCIPFVLWLSVTGGIYLFKPQIEAWMDRPYDSVAAAGQTRATPETQVKAALAAIPGSNLHFYELPRHPGSAAQIIVGKGEDEFRVYVNPGNANVLKID